MTTVHRSAIVAAAAAKRRLAEARAAAEAENTADQIALDRLLEERRQGLLSPRYSPDMVARAQTLEIEIDAIQRRMTARSQSLTTLESAASAAMEAAKVEAGKTPKPAFGIFSKSRRQASAAISEALSDELATAEKARAKLAELSEKRRTLLLADGADVDLDQTDAEILAVTRERDRAIARSDTLSVELEISRQREVDEARLAKYREARARNEAATAWLQTKYEQLARELAAGFALLERADHEAFEVDVPEGETALVAPSAAREHDIVGGRVYYLLRCRLESLDPLKPALWDGNKASAYLSTLIR